MLPWCLCPNSFVVNFLCAPPGATRVDNLYYTRISCASNICTFNHRNDLFYLDNYEFHIQSLASRFLLRPLQPNP